MLPLTAKGYADNDVNAKLKIELMNVISRITNPGMSKSQKLYASWCYLTSSSTSYYSGYRQIFLIKKGSGRGRLHSIWFGWGGCFGIGLFSFAAMAREIGYNPYVVLGRVSGTRDGAADGLTSHGGSLLTDATMIRRHSLQDGTEVYTEAAATTSIIRLRAL